MSHRHRSFSDNQQGFSLTEMLVGMLIASVIMLATYQLFDSQARLSATEMRVNNLQMNTQQVIRYLTEQFRNAGYGITTKVNLQPVQVYDSTDLSMSDTEPGDNNPGQGSGAGATGGNWTPGELGLPGDILVGTDVIRILKGTERYSEMFINDYNAPSQHLNLKAPNLFTDNLPDGDYGNAHDPFVGGLMLVYSEDCGSLIIQLTQITANSNDPHGTLVVFNPGWGGDYNSNTGLGCDFSGGSAIFLGDAMGNTNTLYVDSRYMLRIQTPDASFPLMDNVINMQMECGLDTTGDGAPDTWKFKPSAAEKMQLKALRVYLYTITSVSGLLDSRAIATVMPAPIDDYDPTDPDTNGTMKDENGNYKGVVRQYVMEVNFRNIAPGI